MFEGWDNFYLVVGGASGALIGLLFVVATLNSGQDRSASLRGASVYLTPVVFHFVVVLVLSALALAPRVGASAATAIVVLCALGGLAHSVRIVWIIYRGRITKASHWSDLWCYGAAPGVIYAGLAWAAWALAGRRDWAADGVALAAMALLLVSIRNAWDLVTWLAPRRDPPA
jgi:hypothetical protein